MTASFQTWEIPKRRPPDSSLSLNLIQTQTPWHSSKWGMPGIRSTNDTLPGVEVQVDAAQRPIALVREAVLLDAACPGFPICHVLCKRDGVEPAPMRAGVCWRLRALLAACTHAAGAGGCEVRP